MPSPRPPAALATAPRRRSPAPVPSSVAEVLHRALRARGWETRLRGASLFHRWPELVGTEIARHSLPLGVRAGVLVVAVRHQAWATQLSFLRSDLLRRLRSDCGAAIRDIIFEVQWNAGFNQLSPVPDQQAASGPSHDPQHTYHPRDDTTRPPAARTDVFAAFRAWQTAAVHRSARVPDTRPTPFRLSARG